MNFAGKRECWRELLVEGGYFWQEIWFWQEKIVLAGKMGCSRE